MFLSLDHQEFVAFASEFSVAIFQFQIFFAVFGQILWDVLLRSQFEKFPCRSPIYISYVITVAHQLEVFDVTIWLISVQPLLLGFFGPYSTIWRIQPQCHFSFEFSVRNSLDDHSQRNRFTITRDPISSICLSVPRVKYVQIFDFFL